MTDPASPRVRLVPFTDRDFLESLTRSRPRHAEELVLRGQAIKEQALKASEDEFNELLPQGRRTPNWSFENIIDSTGRERVGETWYSRKEWAGKVRFWVDWLWVEPQHRRRGYALETLRQLELKARESGAERIGLNVWTDNAPALALYSKLGYAPVNMRMLKALSSA